MGGCFSACKPSGGSDSDSDTTPTAIPTVVIIPHRRQEEEEEEDVYQVHRKDAHSMARSASDHAKAATEAYARGDKVAAQKFSRIAREENAAAKKLHAKAAKRILKIKNSKNDLWKLDLHGLHVPEAVQALKQHLQKIESSSVASTRTLLVITGRGNHSRGEPKLPGAIRKFLNKNGYTYNGGKPGVITVQPKFRQ